MATDMKTPIIVGVGDIKNKSSRREDAKEPTQLMLEAIEAAIRATGLSSDRQAHLQKRIDSIDVVATWSWPYSDLPGLIAHNVGAELKHGKVSDHGGNCPALMLHQSSARIADGSCSLAVVTSGEALASLVAFHRAGVKDPDGLTARPAGEKSLIESIMDESRLRESVDTRHAVGQPIHVYPMFENALRAHRGQTYQQNLTESAELYAGFAQVAASNPTAWTYGDTPVSTQTLETAEGKNRMICTHYPLLMNALNNVNQASACLLTSTDVAIHLGIPQDLWESDKFWLRPNYHSSTAIENAIDTALGLAGLEKQQIDILDIYLCFPIVPKLACQHMGISVANPSKPIILPGGLTSFGGAGYSYSGNAIVAMVRELRQGEKQHGLVLANGGLLTHQNAIVLSNKAPQRFGLPLDQAHHTWSDEGVHRFTEHAEGEGLIETYIVEFDRKGRPSRGHIVGRLLENQNRFIANHGDNITLAQLASTTEEPIRRKGFVSTSKDGRNLFSFEVKANLSGRDYPRVLPSRRSLLISWFSGSFSLSDQ